MKLAIEDFVSSGESRIEHILRVTLCLKEEFDEFYRSYDSLQDLLPTLGVDRLRELVVTLDESGEAEKGDTEQLYQQVAASCKFIDRAVKEQIAEFQLKSDRFEQQDLQGSSEEDADDVDDEEFMDEDDEDSELPDEELEQSRSKKQQRTPNDIGDEVADDDGDEQEEDEEEDDEDEEELAAQVLYGKDPFGTKSVLNGVNGIDENTGDDDQEDMDEAESDEASEENEEDDEDNDLASNNDEDQEEEKLNKEAKNSKSVAENKFFKLDELEAFLEREDRKEERRIALESGGSGAVGADSDDEELDFAALEGTGGETIKYSDFWGEDAGESKSAKKRKQVTFGEDETYEVPSKKKQLFGGGEDDENEDAPEEGELSMHDKRMQKYRDKISKMEDVLVADKPWQLTGEVTAKVRPENSLLEEIVDFDSNAKPPPIITADKTESIEKLIIQRIKDNVFDDVERKFRPKEQPFEYRKRILLDQDKSQLSLAEVYEKEYLEQQQEEKTEEKNPAHEEIRRMMKDVFLKLDALSQFTLAPPPAKAEMAIVSNVPAIQVEEAVPIAVADSGLLAPEEIHKVKPSDEKASEERTKTDKLRQRRKKKNKARAISAAEAKKLDPNSKEKALLDLKKASRGAGGKSLTVIKDSKTPSSKMTTTAFFSKLQDQISAVPASGEGKKKKKTAVNNEKDIKKFKL